MSTQSFLMGQFVATTELAERSISQEMTLFPKISKEEFCQKPEMMFHIFQKKLYILQCQLKECNKKSILQELNDVYELLDKESPLSSLNQREFLEGFDFQIRCSKYVWM